MANTQDVVSQLLGVVAKNPEILTSLLNHPYSTIGKVTNNDNVSKTEASQVVTAIAAMASGKKVNFNNLAGASADLLSQNNNSVHSLANMLLGSGSQSMGVDLTGGLTSGILGGLAKGVDLSDGLDAGDLIGLAATFLK